MAGQQTVNICLDFAKSSPDVRGLVLLGSYAVDQSCSTSDVDLLFVLKPDANISIHQERLCTLFKNIARNGEASRKAKPETGLRHSREMRGDNNGTSTSAQVNDENDIVTGIHMYKCDIRSRDKTAIYVVNDDQKILKIDCAHTIDVLDKVRFIVGSEIKLKHLPKVVLLDYTEKDKDREECEDSRKNLDLNQSKSESGEDSNKSSKKDRGHIYRQLETILTSVDPYSASGLQDADPLFHIHNFVENFDNCCKNFDNGDMYRTQFHIFLLRHRIFCLLWLSWGHTAHAYLPKMLHQELEVRGIGEEVWKGIGNDDDVVKVLAHLLVLFENLKFKELERGGGEGDQGDGKGSDIEQWSDFLRFRLEQSFLLKDTTGEKGFMDVYRCAQKMSSSTKD